MGHPISGFSLPDTDRHTETLIDLNSVDTDQPASPPGAHGHRGNSAGLASRSVQSMITGWYFSLNPDDPLAYANPGAALKNPGDINDVLET